MLGKFARDFGHNLKASCKGFHEKILYDLRTTDFNLVNFEVDSSMSTTKSYMC